MNIGMILNSRFPPDIRVEKEARSLIKAGHNVYLLSDYAEGRPAQEEVSGIIVQRIPPIASFSPLRETNLLQLYLTFKSELWRRKIAKFVNAFKIDVLHVHDLPLVSTSISVAREKGIPIVADLHENYPAALQVWRSAKRSLKQILADRLLSLSRWIDYEKKCVQEVDHVIVVVDEAKERLLRYGVAGEKITVLMNVVEVDYFTSVELDSAILSRYKKQNAFIISYVGGFGPHRGLDTAIKAMTYLREEVPTAKLLLIGAQWRGKYGRVLQKLMEEYHIEDSVEITGWQPFEKVPSYIQASDVCLVPHHRNPHTDSTIPHKLFQYMLMGKPVIVSDCRPLKRIVEETGSGLVFRAGDARALAEKIVALYEDRTLREQCGQAGRRAVLGRYNWELESRKLIRVYEKNIG